MKKIVYHPASILIVGLVVVYICIIAVASNSENKEIMSDKIRCDFSKIPDHEAMQDPCSPGIEEFDIEWRGIKINMPDKVAISGEEDAFLDAEGMRVPVYLLLQLTMDRLIKYDLEREGITLIFIDQSNGKSFENSLLESGTVIPGTKIQFSQKQMENRIKRHYYNINALEFIELPSNKTTYDVYATFEEFKSNVMTVAIK